MGKKRSSQKPVTPRSNSSKRPSKDAGTPEGYTKSKDITPEQLRAREQGLIREQELAKKQQKENASSADAASDDFEVSSTDLPDTASPSKAPSPKKINPKQKIVDVSKKGKGLESMLTEENENLKEEIGGLKEIIEELQQRVRELSDEKKVLEDEDKAIYKNIEEHSKIVLANKRKFEIAVEKYFEAKESGRIQKTLNLLQLKIDDLDEVERFVRSSMFEKIRDKYEKMMNEEKDKMMQSEDGLYMPKYEKIIVVFEEKAHDLGNALTELRKMLLKEDDLKNIYRSNEDALREAARKEGKKVKEPAEEKEKIPEEILRPRKQLQEAIQMAPNSIYYVSTIFTSGSAAHRMVHEKDFQKERELLAFEKGVCQAKGFKVEGYKEIYGDGDYWDKKTGKIDFTKMTPEQKQRAVENLAMTLHRNRELEKMHGLDRRDIQSLQEEKGSLEDELGITKGRIKVIEREKAEIEKDRNNKALALVESEEKAKKTKNSLEQREKELGQAGKDVNEQSLKNADLESELNDIKARLETLQKEYDQTQEDLTQTKDLSESQKTTIESLTARAEELEKELEKRSELSGKEVENLENQLKEKNAKIEEIQQQLENLRDQLEAAQKGLTDKSSEAKQKDIVLATKEKISESERKQLKKKIKDLEKEKDDLLGEIKKVEASRDALRGRLERAENDKNEWKKSYNEVHKLSIQFGERNEKLQQNLKDTTSKLDQAKTTIRDLEGKVRRAEAEIKEKEKEGIANTKKAIELFTEIVDRLRGYIKGKEAEIIDITKKADSEKVKYEENIKKLKNKRRRLFDKVVNLRSQIKELQGIDISALLDKGKADELKNKLPPNLHKFIDDIAKLEKELKDLKDGLKNISKRDFSDLVEYKDNEFVINDQKVNDLKKEFPNDLDDLISKVVSYTKTGLERVKLSQGLKIITDIDFDKLVEYKDNEVKIKDEEVKKLKQGLFKEIYPILEMKAKYALAEKQRERLTKGLKAIEAADLDKLIELIDDEFKVKEKEVDKLKVELIKDLHSVLEMKLNYRISEKQKSRLSEGIKAIVDADMDKLVEYKDNEVKVNDEEVKKLRKAVPKDLYYLVNYIVSSARSDSERYELISGLKKIMNTGLNNLVEYKDNEVKINSQKVNELKNHVIKDLYDLVDQIADSARSEAEKTKLKEGLKAIEAADLDKLIEYKDDKFEINQKEVDKLKSRLIKDLHPILKMKLSYRLSEKQRSVLEKGLNTITNADFAELIEYEDNEFKVNDQKVNDFKNAVPNDLDYLVNQIVSYTKNELERNKLREGLKAIADADLDKLIELKDDEFYVKEEEVDKLRSELINGLGPVLEMKLSYRLSEKQLKRLTEGLDILADYKDIDKLTEQAEVDKLNSKVSKKLYFVVERCKEYAEVKKERDEFKDGLEKLKKAIENNEDIKEAPDYLQTIVNNYTKNKEAEAEREKLLKGISKICKKDYAQLIEDDEVDKFKKGIPDALHDIVDQYVGYEKRISELEGDLRKAKKVSNALAKINPTDLVNNPEGLKQGLPPEYHPIIDALAVLAKQPIQQAPVPQPYMMQPGLMPSYYQPGQRGTLAVLYELSARVGRIEGYFERKGLPVPDNVKEVREELNRMNPSFKKIK
jgi:chromosome segregation ATPase